MDLSLLALVIRHVCGQQAPRKCVVVEATTTGIEAIPVYDLTAIAKLLDTAFSDHGYIIQHSLPL